MIVVVASSRLRPQAVMATAQVLFHRFFCKRSFRQFRVRPMATAVLFLSAKLEESPRAPRDCLAVFYRMDLRERQQDDPSVVIAPLETGTNRYDRLKKELIRNERILLREFGFVAHVEPPHKLVLSYLNVLGLSGEEEKQQQK